MIRRRLFLVSSVTAAAALTFASGAQATVASWFGFEGGSQMINCTLGECFRPPDTMGAVGTTQFVETANGYIRVYDKMTGSVLSSLNMANFWTLAGLPGGGGGDQRVLFDHYTNRWIMTGFGSTVNKINIGISDTANAAGPWKSTQIVGASIGIAGTLDYPTLGMDNKGVYIGTNNFNPGYTGSSLFVIPKTSLTAAAPSTTDMTFFTSVARGNTPQVAVNWQGNPTNTASLMGDSNIGDNQVFYQITGVNGPGAVRTPLVEIPGSGYIPAGDGRQPDGSRIVDTLSPRITGNVAQVNGRLYSAITVRNGADDHAAVRWSVNDATTGAVLQTGLISGGGFDYYEGSIAVNEFGQAVIGFNRSGLQTTDGNGDGLADGNISFMARAFNPMLGGGLVQSGADVLLRVSAVSDYHCSTRSSPGACTNRWGDYSAVSLNPTNHQTFYAIGEYTSGWGTLPAPFSVERAIWNTYVAAITLAPVPEPETWALMLAGLVGIGSLARRRRA